MNFSDTLITPSTLLQFLSQLLEEDLGKYEIVTRTNQVLATIPSIWISPPQLPSNRTMKQSSGVECVIARSPQFFAQTAARNRRVFQQKWSVVLTQYKLDRSLNASLEKIACAFSAVNITTRSQQQRKEGLFLEQARVTIPEYKLMEDLT